MSRFAKAFGYFSLGLGISLVIGYWLKQEERRSRQQPSPIGTPPIEEKPLVLSSKMLDAAPTVPDQQEPAAEADDLTRINGIGPKTAEALHALGITTYRALADWAVEDLANQLTGTVRGINAEKVSDWKQQAIEFVS